MGSAQLAYVSEAEYLSGEELPGPRHEYVDGQHPLPRLGG